jgi:hypothetical protein
VTACWHPAPWLGDTCCDPTRDDELTDEYGPVGEACAGLDDEGWPCPRAAVAGLWCHQHSEQRDAPAPLILEVAA